MIISDNMARHAAIAFCEPVYGYKNFEPNEKAIAAMKAVLERVFKSSSVACQNRRCVADHDEEWDCREE